MTWDEHFEELNRIRALCEQHRSLLPEVVYSVHRKYLADLEADRWCKGEDPYGFLRSILATYIDLEPNLAEYNAEGYLVTIREADKRLSAYEPTRWQVDRLLGYASWIQVHGWQALKPGEAEQLRSEYRHAGVDPEAIDFAPGD